MKKPVFWEVELCSVVEFTSEENTAYKIRVTVPPKHCQISVRLQAAT